jgi:hypothetical protein
LNHVIFVTPIQIDSKALRHIISRALKSNAKGHFWRFGFGDLKQALAEKLRGRLYFFGIYFEQIRRWVAHGRKLKNAANRQLSMK